MAKFLTELKARCLTDKIWVLDEDLVYQSDLVGKITAPKGFYTDFASVPRVPIAYMLFGDRAHHESVIHDLGYRIDASPAMTRKQVDQVFLEAMRERGKSWATRYTMYWAVRLGAGSSWHRRKVADVL